MPRRIIMENCEIWKDCKGYEGLYQVSSLGRIWSVRKQRYIKSYKKTGKNEGYLEIQLVAKNGKIKYERVHRLVALAFIPNPNNYTIVNHLNGIKDDNRVENLEWTTVQGNTQHAVDNNLGGYNTHLKEMTEKARIKNAKTYLVYKDGELIGEYKGRKEAGNAANVSEKTVQLCVKEHRTTRKGFSFEVKGGDANA